MPEPLMELFSTPACVISLKIALVLLSVIFFGYYFSKEGKDERGRDIIACSCVRGIFVFFILMNVCGQYTYSIISHPYIYASALALTYDLVLVVILVNILVLRKLR